ncbi:MAG: SDR family NAD(P)-dependent oxidoreductase [Lachnospiraceae bacterium]|nr:SDR family NAD(P)-dependent oxidoreductase [Lachnospiraceae bacterium]
MDNQANAIITGASGDIGAAIAIEAAKAGMNLAIIGGSNKDALNETKDKCLEYGVKVLSYQAALENEEECSRIIRDVSLAFSEINLLVNCAGVSVVKLLQDCDYSDWTKVINSNLTSIYNCCHEVTPYMIKQQSGKIINISSVWGQHGASMEVIYSASKGGVDAFTKALAKELAPSNIAVNALSLGFIDTKMNAHLTDEDRNSLKEEIPIGRFADAKEVGEAVLTLSQMSNYLTGQIITFDGGWTV